MDDKTGYPGSYNDADAFIIKQSAKDMKEMQTTIDTQAARIAELEGEVRRLTQCDTNMKFLLDCLEKAELQLPDYTLGTWQDRAKGLAPSISRMTTRLTALEQAAGDVVNILRKPSPFDCSCDNGYHQVGGGYNGETGEEQPPDLQPCSCLQARDEYRQTIEILAALLAEKKVENG